MGDKEDKSKEPVIGKAPGHQYDAKSIRVLGGIEAVRLRPAMYIGSTGELSLHHLVGEVVDSSVDEAMAGHADEINVTVHADDSVTVVDNGRGIPVDMHATEKRPAAEVVLTVLHAGGKFDSETYKVSGGLHGVGVSVVNALSDWLELEIWRDGEVWEQSYECGTPKGKIKVTGKTRKTGTKITFHPDPSIFENHKYSYDILAQRLRELAFLNKGLKITLTDERSDKSAEFRFTGGIAEFVKHLNKGKQVLHDSPVYMEGKKDTVEIEIALQYNDSYTENVFAFANTINTVDGGTHLSGFRSALTRTINNFASSTGMLKEQKDEVTITGDDVREGLVAVVSVKLPQPQFEGQTKGKLMNVEKARYDKMLGHEEIRAIITALGTGIGKDDFDPAKLRYHKIILMTDADVDGSHIRTLLLTFFFRHMTELIRREHIYIAQPPLYRVKRGKSDCYIRDEDEFNHELMSRATDEHVVKPQEDAALQGAALTKFLLNVQEYDLAAAKMRRQQS